MNGRDEATGGKAEEDARGEVVFAEAVAELEILVEHGAEGEGDGLFWGCIRWGFGLLVVMIRGLTLRRM